MTGRIHEILMTYVRRLSAPRAAFMLLIPLIGMLQLALMPLKTLSMSSWMILYLPALIAIHMKQQVIYIRERRLPSALGLHLAIGTGLVLLVTIGVPLMRMSITGQWSCGFLGIVLAGTAVVFGGVITANPAFWFAIPLLIWVTFVPAAQGWLTELFSGRHEDVGIALVATSLAMIWASMAYLREMTEENRAYHWRADLRAADIYERGSVETAQSIALRAAAKNRWWSPRDPSESAIAQWPRLAHGSLWQRMRLRDYCRKIPAGLYVAMILFPVFTLLPQYLIGRGAGAPIFPGMIFPTLFPAYLVLAQFALQRPLWASELLRPAGRREFVLGLFTTWARQVVQVWLALAIGWIGVSAVLGFNTTPGTELPRFLVLSAIVQIFLFSTGVWFLRYREKSILTLHLLLGILVFSIIGGALAPIYRNLTPDPVSIAIVCVTVILMSALITWDAYRRWLNTELG
jgi:hypothetical protein